MAEEIKQTEQAPKEEKKAKAISIEALHKKVTSLEKLAKELQAKLIDAISLAAPAASEKVKAPAVVLKAVPYTGKVDKQTYVFKNPNGKLSISGRVMTAAEASRDAVTMEKLIAMKSVLIEEVKTKGA